MSATQTRRLTPAVRKGAVIVMYSAYALGAAAWMASDGSGDPALSLVALACFAATAGALYLLFHGTAYWRWGNAPEPALDEFEVAARNVAYRIAYGVVAGATLMALLAERLAWDVARWSADDRARDVLFWGWFLVLLTLPSAILAWTERAPDDDDVDI